MEYTSKLDPRITVIGLNSIPFLKIGRAGGYGLRQLLRSSTAAELPDPYLHSGMHGNLKLVSC